ncbi:hypothetical protein NIES4072_65680 [Nostoc commune NIES-4072]|uniref:DUF928 domain-containing protein n=1 Tax=Nostoc commune NIES-4072 TaxID=2005467 RepID=A0A2R5FVS2_NOSCO|nr:hypothetical protein [Nostoc commune]BBD70202.1 hypothetical protein NIES4070_66130 [Nostoc commune HK-02]GBG22856.1 hypothetical protein NIES4072_65680 [Nostoc commune NIES-4072]
MNKLLLHIVVLSTIALSTAPVLSNQAIPAKKSSIQQTFSWANISRILFSKKPPVEPRKGGSRPSDAICMVSPDAPAKPRIVWSDRPLFIWKGRVQTIAVRPINSEQDLWNQPVTQTQNITYQGQPLQPGQTYQWMVNSSRFVPFQIMETQQRDRITAELKTLENQLQAQGADIEAIAFAKAKYFADSNLWSDALQQAYSVQNRSDGLQEMIKNIDNLCDVPKSDAKNSATR